MANRLSTIVTRTGDDGSTGLADGSRLFKDHVRIACLGDADELNAFIGLWLAETLRPAIVTDLKAIQQDLFQIGAELSVPGQRFLSEDALARLDQSLADYNATLPRLREFILPGGGRASALAHVCRTVCRRLERTLVQLAHHEGDPTQVSDTARRYCNRLSDLFFVMGRIVHRDDHPDHTPEDQWHGPDASGASSS
jgi:cob(I)alamin adenosyltransferase